MPGQSPNQRCYTPNHSTSFSSLVVEEQDQDQEKTPSIPLRLKAPTSGEKGGSKSSCLLLLLLLLFHPSEAHDAVSDGGGGAV